MLAESSQMLFSMPPGEGTDSSEIGIDIDPSGKKFLVRVGTGDSGAMREISVRLNWVASLDAQEDAR